MKEIPPTWERPSQSDTDAATDFALSALRNGRLIDYYDSDGDYAGASFLNLGDNDPTSIEADDLHAASLLSIKISPGASRRLLDDGPARANVLTALNAIPLDANLRTASSGELESAWKFHDAVKSALSDPSAKSPSPWVTAAKITARKRPNLIPVRDRVVGDKFGKQARASAWTYWQLMQAILLDANCADALVEARSRVHREAEEQCRRVTVDRCDLRFLDAALWMQVARS